MQHLRPSPDLLDQNPHFSEVPGDAYAQGKGAEL